MKHKCPACGHEWAKALACQRAGPRAQLKGLTKQERSAKMRALVMLRWSARTRAATPGTHDRSPPATAEPELGKVLAVNSRST